VTTNVSLAPAALDLSGVRAGDRNAITLTLTVDGQPLDLTGFTLAAQARTKITDADVALAAEVEVTDALAGVVALSWPGEDVRTLLGTSASWSGVWDLEVRSVGVEPLTVVAGKIKAEADVTRP
jgi:hypothetical protein